MIADDLFVLLAVERAGSLSGAGRALGVSHTTVARQIKALEERMGARLLESQGSALGLTTQGAEVARVAEQFEEDLWRLERKISPLDAAINGTIRLTTVDVLAHIYAARFAEFATKNPLVKLDVVTGTEIVSLAKREADIALRFAEPREESLIGRVVDRLAFGVYGKKGAVDCAVEFSGNPWLVYSGVHCARHTEPWREKFARGEQVVASIATPMVMASMIRSGVGIGLLPCALGDRDPELVCLVSDTDISINVWLLVPAPLRQIPRIRALMDLF